MNNVNNESLAPYLLMEYADDKLASSRKTNFQTREKCQYFVYVGRKIQLENIYLS